MIKIKAHFTLNLKAGKATSAPPVGPMLSQFQINSTKFCKEYNEKTQNYIKENVDTIIPVVIIIYTDLSYSFKLKACPTSILIKQKLNLKSGAKKPSKQIVGTVQLNQLNDLIDLKIKDLNTNKNITIIKILKGTLINMGIAINE